MRMLAGTSRPYAPNFGRRRRMIGADGVVVPISVGAVAAMGSSSLMARPRRDAGYGRAGSGVDEPRCGWSTGDRGGRWSAGCDQPTTEPRSDYLLSVSLISLSA